MAHRRIGPFYSLSSLDAFQAVPGDADDKSVELNGTNEYLRTLQNTNKLGPNNAWTVALWWKPDVAGANDYCVYLNGDTGTNENAFKFYSQGQTTLRVDVHDSGGILRKRYNKGLVWADQTWGQMTFTWDGSVGVSGELNIYSNGVDIVPTKNQDAACTQDDELYEVAIGSTIQGSALAKMLAVHSLAIWDEAITSAECLAIYNGGDGTNFDYSQDSGSYASSANLVRWWRIGLDSGDIGKEYVSDNVDLMDNASNIDATDIVEDSPT